VVFTLLILMSGLAAQETPAPRPLKPTKTVELQVPSFGAFGEPHCDDNLNVYYHLATRFYSHTLILGFSQSGNQSTLYKLPDKFAESMAFVDFNVTPGGDVNALVEDEDGHAILFAFDSEGNAKDHVRLQLPEHVAGRHIAVFPSGTVLFSGYYRSDAPADVVGNAYVGLFQPSGKLLKKLGHLNEKIATPEKGNPAEGGTTVGRNGNVYLLTANKVLVISPSGRIEKEITFTKPGPEFSAVRVQYSEGLLAISFAKPGKDQVVLYQYLVLNASDGSLLGLYEPTEETGNSNVCFSRHDGFLFLTGDKNTLNLTTAPLR